MNNDFVAKIHRNIETAKLSNEKTLRCSLKAQRNNGRVYKEYLTISLLRHHLAAANDVDALLSLADTLALQVVDDGLAIVGI